MIQIMARPFFKTSGFRGTVKFNFAFLSVSPVFGGRFLCIAFHPKVSKKKKRAHVRSLWRCGTSLKADSHWVIWVVGVVQKTQKTRCRVLSPLSFGLSA